MTPIGSVLLGTLGQGIYFDVFNRRLSTNADRDPNISILVVDSARLKWVKALLTGSFSEPPGIRMIGRVGLPRPSTDREVQRFRKVVGPLLLTRGGAAMWGSLDTVRDISVTEIERLNLGQLTGRVNRPQ